MQNLTIKNNELFLMRYTELIRISACGKNAIRFQSFPDAQVIDENYTLMPQEAEATAEEFENYATLTCGTLKVKVEPNGKLTFFKDGKKILEEKPELTFHSNYRHFDNKGSGLWSARVMFEPNENEHFFGLGHSWDNEFDLKGSSIDIRNVNAKCTIPYVYSSLGYGFLWNNPSTGLCELSKNRTRWSCDCCRFMDFVVIAGTPKEACTTLADLTGYSPKMPAATFRSKSFIFCGSSPAKTPAARGAAPVPVHPPSRPRWWG